MSEHHPVPDLSAKPAEDLATRTLRPHERILILDMWQRSGLAAREFGALVGLSRKTLFDWKRRFDRLGPAGLSDDRRGAPQGSRLPEATQRAILMLKQAHPEWGCERIREVLLRGEGYSASVGAVAHVLRESGYELEELETTPHAPAVQHFERARPNQLWQTDLFTFLLKRENRCVYLVVYLDDHSRFIVGYGVYASASGALVREVLEAAIANFGAPEEVLTDNGPQYVTWRGCSSGAAFGTWSPGRDGRRPSGKRSAFGAPCGGSACRARCFSASTPHDSKSEALLRPLSDSHELGE